MKIIHPGSYELRIKDSRGIYRVKYVLAVKDKILIPQAFTKKAQQTFKNDIEISIQRLQELLDEKK
jgi:phage-related protein